MIKELNLQKFLRSTINALKKLAEPPYSLIIKEDGNLVLFKYTQGVSDASEPIVNEARGIILEKDTWNVVCYPFNRFYNYTQEHHAELDMSELHVYEKLDGSLIKIFFYDGEWRCATNGNIDAKKTLLNGNKTFFSLVEKAINWNSDCWNGFCMDKDKNKTYMYELCTPENTIVIPYSDYHLFYLGERDNITFEESFLPEKEIESAQEYAFSSFQDIVEKSQHLPDDAEGYVVRDKHWNRVKVKNPKYFLLHSQLNNGKPDLYELVLHGDVDEFLGYFPQYKKQVEEIQTSIVEKKKKVAEIQRKMKKKYAEMVRESAPREMWDYFFKGYDRMDFEEYSKDWNKKKWEDFDVIRVDFSSFLEL